MKLFTTIIFAALLAVPVFAQPTPLPSVPISNNTGQATTCNPVDVVVTAPRGLILRFCDGASANQYQFIGGGFEPGFIRDSVRLPGGEVMILKDDGQVIRNGQFFGSQWFFTPGGSTFIRADFNDVVVHRPGSQMLQYQLSYDGSAVVRPMWFERTFPNNCTKILSVGGDKLCVDRDNNRILRANAVLPNVSGEPEKATVFFETPGLTYAQPYRNGLLVLVRPQFDCGSPVEFPEGASFCYFAGQCKKISPSRLFFLSGRENPTVREIPVELEVGFATTFAVAGDALYIVESKYNDKQFWEGDSVSRLDLLTGKKTVFLSVADFESKFGLGTMPQVWVH
jgi:hypothetical protein